MYNNACYASKPEPTPVSRPSSKRSTASSATTKVSKPVHNYVKTIPEQRILEPRIEEEQRVPDLPSLTQTTTATIATNTTNTTINETRPALPPPSPPHQQTSNAQHSTDDFEFIEIKGIRGIWVKKDATKNPSILINNYVLDTEKEKLIEDCEPSDATVIRERPPEPPKAVGSKVITIPGKRMSPPPRRVIIEKQPPQPQTTKVIVERWLPYEKQERRVIVQKPCEQPAPEKPKNLIIEWEPNTANTEKKIQILGVETADPNEYIAKYGPTLRTKAELPKFALNVKGPDGINLDDASVDTSSSKDHRLVGDVDGLNLIDLEKEGLSMYKKYVEKK